jgi:hypothetical protein
VRKLAIALSAVATIALAQTNAPEKAPEPKPESPGVIGSWDAVSQVKALAQRAKALEPVLTALDPEAWIEKGAPQAYVRQLQSTQLEMRNLVASADRFARRPEQLSAALDTYFLMQNMEQLAGSLSEGVRKYQSGELADQLVQALVSNSMDKDQLKSYILDLTRMREQEFQVVNEEAQRCRAMISRQSDPPRRSRLQQQAPAPSAAAPKAQ